MLCRTDARSLICPDAMTSTTFIFTRSQPRSLLSMARLKRARSRWFSASSSRTLIAQTCLGLSGLFWPTIRPLFQAGRSARMAGKFGPLPGRAMLRNDETPLRPASRALFRAGQNPRPTGDGRDRAEPAQGRKQDHTNPANTRNRVNRNDKIDMPAELTAGRARCSNQIFN